jgi:L-alanine-DL-glutamate epimerase-like enolase superfamily enzyme
VREARIPFRFGFRHAAAARRASHALFVELEDDAGTRGYGEILTRAYLTGETLEGALAYLARAWPKLSAVALARETRPAESLAALYAEADAARATAAYAGVDVAVHDLWARRFGVAGKDLVGRAGAPAPLTAPIGFGRHAGLVAAAMRCAGFRAFKVKVGESAERDVARVRAVHRAVGAGTPLALDANGAWTVKQAVDVLRALAPLPIAVVEQPTARDDFGALAAVAAQSGIPVMADESLCTSADADALKGLGPAVWWNLRLAKVGGFTGLLALARAAEAAGIPYQLGALVGESAVLTAAARAVLGALRPVRVECAMPRLLLKGDVFRAAPASGERLATRAPLGDTPGLGVEPTAAYGRLPVRLDLRG